jgi:hypothetical protein
VAVANAPEAELTQRFSAARDAIGAVLAVAPERPEGHLQLALLLLDHGWKRSDLGPTGATLLAMEALTRSLELSQNRPEHAAVEERARAVHTEVYSWLHRGCSVETEKARKEAREKELERAAEESLDDLSL